ncbi:MAG TPA: hypothetical protein VFC18_03685 [Burkholderiales bacterium]|nr:hypothetical protein [Burkholderiales bacterium]
MQIDAIRLKQEIVSILQAGVGVVLVALMLTGVGGTIYSIISPSGWISVAYGRSASAAVAALGSLLMIAGLAWFSRGWSSPSLPSRLSDVMVFGFAAAGLAYLAVFLTMGSF